MRKRAGVMMLSLILTITNIVIAAPLELSFVYRAEAATTVSPATAAYNQALSILKWTTVLSAEDLKKKETSMVSITEAAQIISRMAGSSTVLGPVKTGLIKNSSGDAKGTKPVKNLAVVVEQLKQLGFVEGKQFEKAQAFALALKLGLVTDTKLTLVKSGGTALLWRDFLPMLVGQLKAYKQDQKTLYYNSVSKTPFVKAANRVALENALFIHVSNIKDAGAPVVKLTKSEMAALGADQFKGSAEAIAEKIVEWQMDNMTYAYQDSGILDANDFGRFNYVFPGLADARMVLNRKGADGKPYGICFDFAMVYASMADYYGLKTRIVNTLALYSEVAVNEYDGSPEQAKGVSYEDFLYIRKVTAKGLSEEEYKRLNALLQKKKVILPYEAVRAVYSEGPYHMRPEVLVDGKWKAFDAVDRLVKIKYPEAPLKQLQYETTKWQAASGYELAAYWKAAIAKGQRPPATETSFKDQIRMARILNQMNANEPYVGITDDLGQTGRSATIDDFMQGKGLLPYFNSADSINAFFKNNPMIAEELEEVMMDKQVYEAQSGKKLNVIATFVLVDDLSLKDASDWYLYFTGDTLDQVAAVQLLKDKVD